MDPMLMGGGIPRNKADHFLFCKTQLDSRTFGAAGPMGLWTRYHSTGFCLVEFKSQE